MVGMDDVEAADVLVEDEMEMAEVLDNSPLQEEHTDMIDNIPNRYSEYR